MFYVFNSAKKLINYFLTENDARVYAGFISGAYYTMDFDADSVEREEIRKLKSKKRSK